MVTYRHRKITRKITITRSPGQLSVEQQVIVNLVDSLMHKQREKRCTSQDALAYCQYLATSIHNACEINLEKIAGKTIQKSIHTFEDAVRTATIMQTSWEGNKLH